MNVQAHTALAILAVLLLSACFSAAEEQQESVAYVAVPGGQYEYVVSGLSDAETVVFIHGGGLADSFLPIMRDPVLARFQRVRVHRVGYMGSLDRAGDDGPGDSDFVIAVLDDLGIDRAHFVGHSSGTNVVRSVAEDFPGRVASLVIADVGGLAASRTEQIEVLQQRLLLQERLLSVENPRPQSQSGECDGEFALEGRYASVFGDDWRNYFTSVPGGWQQSMTDMCRRSGSSGNRTRDQDEFRRRTLEQQLEEVRAAELRPTVTTFDHPALLLWGGDSLFAESMEIAAQGGSPNTRGQEISGTDHALNVQKPAEIALLISGWLGANPIQ